MKAKIKVYPRADMKQGSSNHFLDPWIRGRQELFGHKLIFIFFSASDMFVLNTHLPESYMTDTSILFSPPWFSSVLYSMTLVHLILYIYLWVELLLIRKGLCYASICILLHLSVTFITFDSFSVTRNDCAIEMKMYISQNSGKIS